MTEIVGIFVRQAGVWERAVPFVRVAGNWKSVKQVYSRVSGVWKTVWADPEACLGMANVFKIVLDFTSPFDTGVGWRLNVDGSSDIFGNPPDANFGWADSNNDWLDFDSGHEYQVQFIDQGSHDLDTVPTLSSFLDTALGPYTFSTTSSIQGTEDGAFDVTFIDKNAPGPAPTLRAATLELSLTNTQL